MDKEGQAFHIIRGTNRRSSLSLIAAVQTGITERGGTSLAP